jgi:hypothetical protein
MKDISFLERLAEDLLEGGFAAAFKSKLEPVQIAKALVREMESKRVVGPEGPLVPNRYSAYLHPDDYGAVAEFRQSLERELENYLRNYASMREFRSLGPISVEIAVAKPPGRRRRVWAEASMADAPAQETLSHSVSSVQATAEMPRLEAGPREATARHPASLVTPEGALISLDGEVTSLGRSIDNDVVIDQTGVSRRHAQIIWEQDRYVLVDLESTNGTFVSGSKISRHSLKDGEEIDLGDMRFTFRVHDDGGSS